MKSKQETASKTFSKEKIGHWIVTEIGISY